MRSDKGDKYYGGHIEDGPEPDPFVRFLQEHEIVTQYTMPRVSKSKMV